MFGRVCPAHQLQHGPSIAGHVVLESAAPQNTRTTRGSQTSLTQHKISSDLERARCEEKHSFVLKIWIKTHSDGVFMTFWTGGGHM